ncbi:MAG: alanine:cation symporter family protein [Alphaproteobacteria bacterium]|nr:alanine:cation symporter family protein [Alphaproteobacteria bacterium]
MVNRQTAEIEPTEGIAPASATKPEIGGTVWVPSLGAERILDGGGEGHWHVLESDVAWDHTPLANPENVNLPIVVAWLVFGAVFFTLRMLFINLRGVPHAVLVTMGRYDDPDHEGEISHFQALSSALSATVGLGNIAGVAIAIGIGGPGAVFWMWVAGFLGMSSKFTECTLGQMYRVRKDDGSVSGGPMHYLDRGLAELGLGPLGKMLSIVFALMCIGGSFGGGNMFQANQSFEAISKVMPGLAEYSWLYGLMLMIAVGVVIIGGIKRIGAAASIVVPVMCGIYILAGLYILVIYAAEVPHAFASIIGQAFSPDAGMGGMIGVLAIGFQRASFSNEAGVGSASIAHSAASTNEPVREGVVALLEPFIDTIVVCSVTALVVVLTGVKVPGGSGIGPTMDAFATILPWFPYVLAFAAMMFAFSTMVSWSYYGESCATFLFGDQARLPYRMAFLGFVFVGSVFKLGNVLDFSDLMILGMAFPNILGALLLSGKVKAALDKYLADLKAGKFEVA